MNILRWLESKKREIGFSHNALTIIAMFSMLLDHIAFVLIQNGKLYGYDMALYENAISLPEARPWVILCKILRMFGRIAFPIYSFLIVEGFRKTGNIFRYLLRILLLAFISEVPFDLIIFNKCFSYDCLMLQNVLFTYFIGLLMLIGVKALNSLSEFLTVIPAGVAVVVCYFLKTDYWLEGILLIYVFYMFRHDLNVKCLIALIITFMMTMQRYYGFGMVSVYFIYFYDGQKGYLDLKRFHYLFYPLHMFVLYGILFLTYWNN
ncbi:MAG: hypothetical protein IKP66_00120 [Lachnospiraceae bacterium]|nr:hypothetical protein [Lachnospiraceae bacterium]